MKIQLICGFLGAGKTTLLKNLLRQHNSDTAILVNEFGELGIDGTLISEGTNLSVTEMPSGCICCTLKENLVAAIREIMERLRPQQLIIEPSGIAAPSSILLGIKNADFAGEVELAPVVGIIDLTFFPDLIREEDNMSNYFHDQILNSDIILLNKADLAAPETIDECRAAIAAINPAALLIPTVYCEVELPPGEAKAEVTHFHTAPQFQAEVFAFTGVFDRGKIELLLKNLEHGESGDVFRAKGIIITKDGSVTFDYVHGLINFGQIKDAAANKLVFIGRNLNRAILEQAVRGGCEGNLTDLPAEQ